MTVRSLNAVAGVTPEIGFYLAGMEEVREQLIEAVEGLPFEKISRLALPEAHSIGALVMHIGEAEWYWMQCVVSGHKPEEADGKPFWDVLEDPQGFCAKDYSGGFCLDEIAEIRKQTKETLAQFNDSDLNRIFSREKNNQIEELSLRWILHHLIDHEAQHKGQILMLMRLMSAKN